MYLAGKMTRSNPAGELVFLWDTETLSEQDDADAQEQARGGANGSVAVDALWNPRRVTFGGKLLVSPNRWGPGLLANAGDVIALPDGTLYQCTQTGATGADEPDWGDEAVTDGTVTWGRRAALYECVRWARDLYDGFFHAGVVKLYLDSDRYHFAQCVARSFEQMENPDVALSWEATYTCPDPIRYDDALHTTTLALTGAGPAAIPIAYEGNAPGAPVLAFDVAEGQVAILVENLNTGERLTIDGAVSAGAVTVDCDEGTIVASAGDPPTCDGELLSLNRGANTLQVSWTGTGPTSVTISHRSRWW
ncbi:MAG TPA: hypothetical protein VGM37_10435 [Armatimonadota bacterium]|jgi:hypothetical protein